MGVLGYYNGNARVGVFRLYNAVCLAFCVLSLFSG
jgi:hypothetical protein